MSSALEVSAVNLITLFVVSIFVNSSIWGAANTMDEINRSPMTAYAFFLIGFPPLIKLIAV
jgi:hypothetical protein